MLHFGRTLLEFFEKPSKPFLADTLNRVRTGHGKPGKSWNLSISVSRPGKSRNLIVGYGKAWKIIVCGVRKLLQVSKQGQNKIQANYARKYLKTRMIFESGS